MKTTPSVTLSELKNNLDTDINLRLEQDDQKVMYSDISGGTEADQVSGGVADVMNDQEVMKCTFTKDGTCNNHGIKAEKLSILTKKWAKKRGGGYGWKTVKISRFLCRARKNLPVDPDIDRHVLPSASQDFRDFSGSQDSQFIGDLPVVIKE